MTDSRAISTKESFGSKKLDAVVEKLKNTSDPRRRYEYILWLAKKLPSMPQESITEKTKVKGCISQVYVLGEVKEGKLHWQGYSDALITKGLLALLIEGLNGLTPKEVIDIDPKFIASTGLHASLTPSRANGFLNILNCMKAQAQKMVINESITSQ